MNETTSDGQQNARTIDEEPKEIDEKAPMSPVLARLIEEVRNEKSESPHGYNRMHNRHNRSR